MRYSSTLFTLILAALLSLPVPFRSFAAVIGQTSPDLHIPAFVYHRFGDSRYPSTNVSLEQFESHLKIIREEGFTTLTLSEALDAIDKGRPGRFTVISVDDAYKSFLTGAVPLLQTYGMKATLFVTTGTVGGGDFLTWDELKAIASAGIEIGHHGHSHDAALPLAGETVESMLHRVGEDLEKASDAFRRFLGQVPELYAYPYGEYRPESRKLIQDAGFKGAAAQVSGVFSNGADRYALPRFPMGGAFTRSQAFREKLLMRALPVTVVTPDTPLMTENPPLLNLIIEEGRVDMRRAQCFPSGGGSCVIEKRGDGYQVRSDSPLQGRRNRYTVTAPDRQGNWYWYSHLWLNPLP